MKKKIGLIIFLAVSIFFGNQLSTNAVNVDKEYKKTLLTEMGYSQKDVSKLDSVVGEKELTKIIKMYNENATAYQIDDKEKGDRKVFNAMNHRANFHLHTVNSDGSMTIPELLNQAAKYANKVKLNNPNEKYPYIVAITDHNTTEGDKEALEILYKNPIKYKNVKVVLGIEIWSYIEQMESQSNRNSIHMLAWAINPYERDFQNMSRDEMEFTKVIDMIQTQPFGLVGVAHPVREIREENIAEGKDIYDWTKDMLDLYVSKKQDKALFTEVYYQRYRFDKDPALLEAVKNEAAQRGIYATGSLDTHTPFIYEY